MKKHTALVDRTKELLMKSISIKDNKKYSEEHFQETPCLIEAIANKTLGQLEGEGVFVFPELLKDAEDITKDQMILQKINDEYWSGNVMGFIGLGNERLTIKSRFCSSNSDYLFQYLLENVLNFPNIVDLETNAEQDDRMFMMLLFLFPSYLAAAMRKGVFKTYVNNKYNDGNVKGVVDIDRHIKMNTPFVGNIAYHQREYTFDNYLIQLVRHTIEYIKRKPYGSNLLLKVKDEVNLIVNATESYQLKDRRKIIAKNKKNTVRHSYFYEYRKLQRLCILILQNEKHQIGTGGDKIYGILFDGAWLWEEYVFSLLNKDKYYHPMNKAKRGAQYLFSGSVGRIYPDFIGTDIENRIIADAKYKPIDNIGNKDYLQLLAYMIRFDSKRSYYLYPEIGNDNNSTYKLNKGTSYENNVQARDDVFITKLGLLIPQDAESYEEFIDRIKKSESCFRHVLTGEYK